LKKPVIDARIAKSLSLAAAVLVATFSLAAGQTAPAAASTAPSPAPAAPTAPASTSAPTAGQVAPGSTGTINHAVVLTPFADGKMPKIFKKPLSDKTRQTLQEAMNSVTPPPADDSSSTSTNTPPAASGH
jgi:Spy/CpxP family protein refolding chaperone